MSRLVRFVVAVAVLAVLGACASASAAAQQPGVLGPAAGGGGVVAKPAIVNGTELQIASVPWQIHLLMRGADGRVFQCGGSILAPTVVATAAHCLFDPATGAHFAVARMTVQAGVSHTATPEPGDVRQSVGVAGVVSHPYYVYDAARGGVAPDDVALLTLAAPLNLGGATARAIGLYAGGPLVAAGTAAYISGYGRQARGVTPNGNLYGVDTVVIDPPQCGAEATALVLCIQSPAGSACEGDSGGPLTVGGLLAGIASFIALNGPTGDCGIGSFNGYANVAAPEIAEFLRGNPAPPRAPRGGVDVGGRGVFQVGGTLTCNPGTWSEAPAFSYAFYDTRDGTLLQQGPAGTYTFAAGDVGRTVACAVTAATAGGTGIARTQASPPIAPAPAPSPPAARPRPRPVVRVSVRSARGTVAPGRTVGFSIRVVNRGGAAARGVVACAAPSRGLAFGRRLPRGARRARGKAPRICWRVRTLRPGAGRTLSVTLRASSSARPRTLVTTASVRGANFTKRVASASVRVRRAARP